MPQNCAKRPKTTIFVYFLHLCRRFQRECVAFCLPCTCKLLSMYQEVLAERKKRKKSMAGSKWRRGEERKSFFCKWPQDDTCRRRDSLSLSLSLSLSRHKFKCTASFCILRVLVESSGRP